MRKLTVLVLVLLGAAAVVGWRAAPSSNARVLATTIGDGSVVGSYAFSETFQDPMTGTTASGQNGPGSGQVGAAAGTLTFDGKGNLTGYYSQNTRGCANPCGDLQVTGVQIAGTYTVYPSGAAHLDLCLHILASEIGPPQTGTDAYVRAIWEGSFSLSFVHFTYIQTLIGDCTPPSPSGSLSQSPNVTAGSADKV
jgi:hypothetical protein